MSRWIRPRSWAAARPSAISRPMRSTSASGSLPSRLQAVVERLALEELHGQEGHAAVLADLVDGDDVIVLDRRRRLGLAQEALPGAGAGGQGRQHGLEGHQALAAGDPRPGRRRPCRRPQHLEDAVRRPAGPARRGPAAGPGNRRTPVHGVPAGWLIHRVFGPGPRRGSSSAAPATLPAGRQGGSAPGTARVRRRISPARDDLLAVGTLDLLAGQLALDLQGLAAGRTGEGQRGGRGRVRRPRPRRGCRRVAACSGARPGGRWPPANRRRRASAPCGSGRRACPVPAARSAAWRRRRSLPGAPSKALPLGVGQLAGRQPPVLAQVGTGRGTGHGGLLRRPMRQRRPGSYLTTRRPLPTLQLTGPEL